MDFSNQIAMIDKTTAGVLQQRQRYAELRMQQQQQQQSDRGNTSHVDPTASDGNYNARGDTGSFLEENRDANDAINTNPRSSTSPPAFNAEDGNRRGASAGRAPVYPNGSSSSSFAFNVSSSHPHHALPRCSRCEMMDGSLRKLQASLQEVEGSYLNEIQELQDALVLVESERNEAQSDCFRFGEEMQNLKAKIIQSESDLQAVQLRCRMSEDENVMLKRKIENMQTQLRYDSSFFCEKEVQSLLATEAAMRNDLYVIEQSWRESALTELRCERLLLTRAAHISFQLRYQRELDAREAAERELLWERRRDALPLDEGTSLNQVASWEKMHASLMDERARLLSQLQNFKIQLVEAKKEAEDSKETELLLQEAVERSRLEVLQARQSAGAAVQWGEGLQRAISSLRRAIGENEISTPAKNRSSERDEKGASTMTQSPSTAGSDTVDTPSPSGKDGPKDKKKKKKKSGKKSEERDSYPPRAPTVTMIDEGIQTAETSSTVSGSVERELNILRKLLMESKEESYERSKKYEAEKTRADELEKQLRGYKPAAERKEEEEKSSGDRSKPEEKTSPPPPQPAATTSTTNLPVGAESSGQLDIYTKIDTACAQLGQQLLEAIQKQRGKEYVVTAGTDQVTSGQEENGRAGEEREIAAIRDGQGSQSGEKVVRVVEEHLTEFKREVQKLSTIISEQEVSRNDLAAMRLAVRNLLVSVSWHQDSVRANLEQVKVMSASVKEDVEHIHEQQQQQLIWLDENLRSGSLCPPMSEGQRSMSAGASGGEQQRVGESFATSGSGIEGSGGSHRRTTKVKVYDAPLPDPPYPPGEHTQGVYQGGSTAAAGASAGTATTADQKETVAPPLPAFERPSAEAHSGKQQQQQQQQQTSKAAQPNTGRRPSHRFDDDSEDEDEHPPAEGTSKPSSTGYNVAAAGGTGTGAGGGKVQGSGSGGAAAGSFTSANVSSLTGSSSRQSPPPMSVQALQESHQRQSSGGALGRGSKLRKPVTPFDEDSSDE